jgi:hypothetical protein
MILGLVFVAWKIGERQWLMREGKRMLAQVTDSLDANDPGWRWDDLNAARKPAPPAEENSALLIQRIKSLTAPDWDKKLSELERDLPDLAPNVLMHPAVTSQMRRDLADSAEAVKLARTLKDKPRGHRDVVFTPDILRKALGASSDTRHAIDVLQRAAVVAIHDGDYTQVADDLVAMLNASRSAGDEPLSSPQLSRLSGRSYLCSAIEKAIALSGQVGQLQSLRLAELQQALADELKEPLLVRGLRGERAVFLILSERLHDGPVDELKCLDLTPHGLPSDTQFAVGWWLYRGRMHGDRAYVIAWYTAAIRAARRPLAEQRAAFDALPQDHKGNPSLFLGNLLLGNERNWLQTHLRGTASAHCALAGIACERYRLKHGRWPESLAELCPEFLAEVPVDPFGTGTIRYAKQPDGVVVYSAAGQRNLAELAGETAPVIIQRTRPGLPEGIEIGFRLWDPDARRLPPPPDPPAPQPPPDEDKP